MGRKCIHPIIGCTKQCAKCNQVKTLDDFYPKIRRDGRRALASRCKSCEQSTQNLQRQVPKREKHFTRNGIAKFCPLDQICRVCKVRKYFTAFPLRLQKKGKSHSRFAGQHKYAGPRSTRCFECQPIERRPNEKHLTYKGVPKFCPLEQTCCKCGVTKSYREFERRSDGVYRRHDCRACHYERSRKYKRDPEKVARSNEKRRPKNRLYNRGYSAAKRARNVANGKPAQGNWHERLPEYVARAAKNGKEFWPRGCQLLVPKPKIIKLRVCKPWNAPGLSDGERWRIRYRLDLDFHASEYLKAQRRKKIRRKYLASGDVDPIRVAQLRLQTEHCAYCERLLPNVSTRELDHVVPFTKGGKHTWTNLAIVCKRCNVKKHARLPTAQEQRAAYRQRARITGQLALCL